MGANKPEDIHKLFTAAFNSGNLEALMALYEPDAQLVPQPGQVTTGHEAIRQALQQFLALKGAMQITTRYVIRGDAIALLSGQWHLKGSGPDGKSVEMGGKSVEVARRQSTGEWLLVIDHPFGAD
jgi:uncharacterized protein (TIGR02246 family)